MKRALLLLAVLVWAPAAHAQGVEVTPVVLNASLERPLTSFQMRNGGEEETAYEVRAFAWRQNNGEDVLTPAPDLIITPSVFALEPGQRQVVRIALPTQARVSDGREQTFRLMVRQLPHASAAAGQTQLLLQLSLPLFFSPRNGAAQLSATGEPSGQQTQLTLANLGNAHAVIVGMRVRTGDSEASVEAPHYILAGASFERTAPRTRDLSVSYVSGRAQNTQAANFDVDPAALGRP